MPREHVADSAARVEPAALLGHIGIVSANPDKHPRSPSPENAGGKPPAPPPDGAAATGVAKEIGGPKGPEPTRYGDWEVGGRCTDF